MSKVSDDMLAGLTDFAADLESGKTLEECGKVTRFVTTMNEQRRDESETLSRVSAWFRDYGQSKTLDWQLDMSFVLGLARRALLTAPLVWTDASQLVVDGFPDDGRTMLVILDREQCREAGIEYHGEPVAVSCWGHKLKTTVGAIRIHPEMVVQFAGPIPLPVEPANEGGK